MTTDFLAFDLSRILRDVVNAAADRDWDRVELKAEDLQVWAQAARKAATDPGADEYPEDGDGRNRGGNPGENPGQ